MPHEAQNNPNLKGYNPETKPLPDIPCIERVDSGMTHRPVTPISPLVTMQNTPGIPQKQHERLTAKIKLLACYGVVGVFKSRVVACQLSIIQYQLWVLIQPQDIIDSKASNAVQATSDFFNYLTRFVESSILKELQVDARASVIHHWIKTAVWLMQYQNYHSLKAVVSALKTPPIARLTNTWNQVDKTDIASLKMLQDTVSEDGNFNQYRSLIARPRIVPTIPYFGIYLHDMSYLRAIAKKNEQNVNSVPKVVVLVAEITLLKKLPPYSASMHVVHPTKTLTDYSSSIRKAFAKDSSSADFYNLMRDSSEEQIGVYAAHWLLSHAWMSEKEVDKLSLTREPKDNSANPDGHTHSYNMSNESSVGSRPRRSSLLSAFRD